MHGRVCGPGLVACHSGCVHTSSTGWQVVWCWYGCAHVIMPCHTLPTGRCWGSRMRVGLGLGSVAGSAVAAVTTAGTRTPPCTCSHVAALVGPGGTSSRVCICGVDTACAVLPAQCCAEGMSSAAPTALQQLQWWGSAVLDKAQGWCGVAWACSSMVLSSEHLLHAHCSSRHLG